MDPYSVDMNDPKVLSLYTKLLIFGNDNSQSELLFDNPDQRSKRALQSMSSKLNLEYEYSLAIGVARITRILPEIPAQDPLVCSEGPQEEFPDFGALPDAEIFDDILPDFASLSDDQLFNNFFNIPRSPSPQPVPTLSACDERAEQLESGFNIRNNGSMVSSSEPNNNPLHIPSDNLNHEDFSFESFSANNFGLSQNINHDTPPFFPRSCPRPIPLQKPKYDTLTTSLGGSYGSYGSSPDSRIPTQNGRMSPFTFSRRMSRESRPQSVSSRSSISAGSTTSRRRGPLSNVARASVNAVKAVGACWRCKVLRKHCDPATPCAMCPKRRTVLWGIIGCKRGDIQMHTAPLNLCPKVATKNGEFGFENEPESTESTQHVQDAVIANIRWHRAIKRREKETFILEPLVTIRGTALGEFLQKLKAREPILNGIGIARESFSLSNLFLGGISECSPESQITDEMGFAVPPVPSHLRDSTVPLGAPIVQDEFEPPLSEPSLIPLDDCIVAIVWELINCPHLEYFQDEGFQMEVAKLCVLLRSAAIYQAKYKNNQLITKSLDCLRASLEALNLKLSGKMNVSIHASCDTNDCAFTPISSLNALLDSYVVDLSQVLFKKENMRHKDWWLSAFYSLCIQAIVRSTLLGLVEGRVQNFPSHQPQGLREYLHVAVRLFIASSGDYDPMMETSPDATKVQKSTGETPEAEAFRAARLALSWNDAEYQSSANYLTHLFEDDGEPLIADT